MSTGHKHPMAPTPTIECHSQKVPNSHASLTIQVSGDHLGILFCYSDGPENEFYIWDWKSGAVKMDLFGDEMDSFVFMSEREVIFGFLGPSENDDLEVSLLVLDFEEESKENHAITEVEHGVSFLFPIIVDRIGLVTLEVRSDPAPKLAPPSQLPFFMAPHNRIFTAFLSIIHESRLQTIMLFAPLATFRSSLDRRIGAGHKRIPWSFWGPKGTRMLMPDRNPSDIWVCYVNASKYVALRKMRRNRTTTILVDVFDFHQPGLSRALSDPHHGTDCVTSTDFFEAGDVFGEQVQTSLPYRLRTLPLDSTYTSDMGVMCGEDHIIIVDVRVPDETFVLKS
ncbi:hypothetical protein DXG03_008941 [Asterophora parasitica]|uniref:Uncharacterized protein n=1 Tax=Asterophora parasitica TaxID=117018 RepID=A0A9P7GCL6_9AGAR|nr:hypothetical protein DXG03_008941 [Asterophora parasitica]